jgi:cytochrome c-550 PedF
MNTIKKLETTTGLKAILAAVLLTLSGSAFSHGDVQPQPMDTEGLDDLGEEWVARNPYSGNERAIEIGAAGYNQNCARCHGLGGVSGGIAPDLRKLPHDADGDEWYQYRVRDGATRNGITYMPVFADTDGGPLSQEALWAIRAWLETIAVE